MKALILAAGLGTRLKPLTDEVPKALVSVGGAPMLERSLKFLAGQGVTEFIVNVHHFADKVEDFLARNSSFGLKVAISDERSMLLETGGGLRHASWFFDDGKPFLLYNVDILTSLNVQEMYQQHAQSAALATLAVSNRRSSRCFLFNAKNRLCGWRNVKTGEEKLPLQTDETLTPLAFGGVHVISPEIFKHLDSFGEKFSIVDVYLSLAASHLIMGYDMRNAQWLDVGKTEALEKARLL